MLNIAGMRPFGSLKSLIRGARRTKCFDVICAHKLKIIVNVTGTAHFASLTTVSGSVKMAITTAEIAGRRAIIVVKTALENFLKNL